ncbi:MAG: hypothetical protein ACJ76H_07660 [Bacteriovoracaceae bacterium]
MKRLLGNVVQALLITTIAIVAVLNSSVKNTDEIKPHQPTHVTVVTAE